MSKKENKPAQPSQSSEKKATFGNKPRNKPTDIKVALLGNPNTGKTSVFNALTGLNQKVGNYPGITVEKKNRQLHPCKWYYRQNSRPSRHL